MGSLGIGNQIIENFFPGMSVSDLWDICPCKMLWEALKLSDVRLISVHEALQEMSGILPVYVVPEPLLTIYQGIEPSYKQIDTESNFIEYKAFVLKMINAPQKMGFDEPNYIISCDFSEMIVITTDNTPSGELLCASIINKQKKTGNGLRES